jgi:hypothetical protein
MRLLLAMLVAAAVGLAGSVAGAATYDNKDTPEGWAWARIRHDEVADLNLRCDPSGKTQLDSHKDEGWNDDCRKIAATFVTDILTEPQLRGQIKRHGMRVRGARIDGLLDLVNAEIAAEVWIDRSRIDGDLALSEAHLTRLLSLGGTRIGGDFAAYSLRADGTLYLSDSATFKGDVVLRGAKVEGQLNMSGSTFEKTMTADSMTVGSSLVLGDGATFKGDVVLNSAKVGGQVDMSGSTFEKTVTADAMTVGISLFLRGGATLKGEVVLRGAKVEGQVDMSGSAFEKTVTADSMTVGSSLFLVDAHFAAPLVVIFTHIGGNLDLRGSVANRIDLSGTAVAGDLRLGGLQWQCPSTGSGKPPAAVRWALGDPKSRGATCETSDPPPRLILRNTQVGALQDSTDAWPPDLDLEGFKYDRLGGLGGRGAADMRARSADQWEDWLQRDRTFSTQPYTQLANVLLTSGHRESAEAIQYAGRGRQRAAEKSWGAWLWLLVWGGVAGYGVGFYTFRVLWWVIGFTALGAVVLSFSGRARAHGVLWVFGASLHRLLPIVELNKDFKDFFENPMPDRLDDEPRNLNRCQVGFFIVLGLAGWILGFILLAAMGGLIPKG